jgi:chaperonin cofactor prefoldin
MSTIDRTPPAQLPALKVRVAAAAAAPAEMPKFKTIDAYESYVRASDVNKLPAATAQSVADNKALEAARSALEARKQAVGYAALANAVAQAEQKLDVANHPMRPQAERLQAEIPEMSSRSASLQQQISELQTRISGLQADQSSNYYNNNNDNSLLGAVLTVGAGLADGSAINSAQKQIRELVVQKANLDAQIMTKTMTAATLAAQPASPEVVKPFNDTLAAARQDLATADIAIKPQVDAVSGAQRTADADGAIKGRLENMKSDLKNYDQRFGPVTQTQLWWKDHSWKKGLDAFWAKMGG